MASNVTVTMTADEMKVWQALERLRAKEQQLGDEAKATGEKSKKASDDASAGHDKDISALEGVITKYASLAGVIMMVKKAFDAYQESVNKGKAEVAENAGIAASLALEARGDKALYDRLKKQADALELKEGIDKKLAVESVVAGQKVGMSEADTGMIADMQATGIISDAPAMMKSLATLKGQGIGTVQALNVIGALGKTAEDMTALADVMAKNVQLAKMVGLSPEQFGFRVAKFAEYKHEDIGTAADTVIGAAAVEFKKKGGRIPKGTRPSSRAKYLEVEASGALKPDEGRTWDGFARMSEATARVKSDPAFALEQQKRIGEASESQIMEARAKSQMKSANDYQGLLNYERRMSGGNPTVSRFPGMERLTDLFGFTAESRSKINLQYEFERAGGDAGQSSSDALGKVSEKLDKVVDKFGEAVDKDALNRSQRSPDPNGGQ